jgi:hypothetical protein
MQLGFAVTIADLALKGRSNPQGGAALFKKFFVNF